MMQERNVNEIPKKDRRLDSLAWLIQGDDVCGATCFDGECLLLATNKSDSKFLLSVIDYLQGTAVLARKKRDNGEKFSRKQTMENFKPRLSCFYKYAETEINLLRNNDIFKKAFMDALEKLTRSIVYYYLRSNSQSAFSKEFIETIEQRQRILIPPKENHRYQNIHAELKILQGLIDRRKLSMHSYIGVSKRCCRNCSIIIKALNNVLKVNLDGLKDSKGYFETRGSHSNLYPSGIPAFLHEFTNKPKHPLKNLEKEFLRLSKANTLKEAFKRNAEVDSQEVETHARSESLNTTSESPREKIILNELHKKTAAKNLKGINTEERKTATMSIFSKPVSHDANHNRSPANSDDGDSIIGKTPITVTTQQGRTNEIASGSAAIVGVIGVLSPQKQKQIRQSSDNSEAIKKYKSILKNLYKNPQ